MKKAFVIFLLALVLVWGAAAAGALGLHATRDQVEVTANTLSGDPAEVRGFTAQQSAQYKNRLIWDMTIPLAQPGDTVTEVSYSLTAQTEDQPTGQNLLNLHVPISTGFGVHDIAEIDHILEGNPEIKPLRPVLEDLADRTAPGQRLTETITLRDYYDNYPFSVMVELPEGWAFRTEDYDSTALTKSFQDYFPLPVDPEEQWEVSLMKSPEGFLEEFSVTGVQPVFDPYLLSVYTDTDLFFAFSMDSAQGVSFDGVSGGFGLYHMDLTPARNGKLSMELDTIKTVYSLPQEAVILDLAFNHDKSALLLTYCLGEDYTCLVLDPDTMLVKQELPVPADPPAEATVHTLDSITGEEITYPIMTWDLGRTLCGDNFLLLYGDETFHLYSLEGMGYRYQFSSPTQEHMFLGTYDHLAGAWNGETLVLGSAIAEYQGYERATGLILSAFEGGELVYQGTYETSLDQISTPEARVNALNDGRINWYDTIRLTQGQELSLTWTG